MKFRLVLNGSEIVEESTPEGIVEQMALLQWPDPGQDKTPPDVYMKDVSARVKERSGVVIKTCCARHFLEDLEGADVIRKA